jgi:pimeloyl-ACP methyl ester carboxylesterase
MKVSSLILCIGAMLIAGGCGTSSSLTGTGGRVVLLHGLGRTDLSMYFIERELSERGYRVFNVGYPSTEHSIEYLAEDELGPALAGCCVGSNDTIHFVTHSMGGIVLRYYLEKHEIENLGRVVMISPPNKGTELADWVAENEFLESVLGPSVEELGTGAESVPRRLGPVDFELGIIAGDRSLNPLFSRLIPGEDDGKVSVEATKVPGMSDFLVVAHSHTYIMMNDDVVEQVAYFLEHGRFRETGVSAPGDSSAHPAGEKAVDGAPTG